MKEKFGKQFQYPSFREQKKYIFHIQEMPKIGIKIEIPRNFNSLFSKIQASVPHPGLNR